MRASVACLSSAAMLCKLVLVASLAVGVFGRTVFNPHNQDDPYDEYSQTIATEYCKATNAEDKVPEVKASIKTFATCVKGVIDTDAITREIEAAKDTGSYDNVIKKYCAKSPQLKDCTSDLIKGVAPCLPPGAVGTSEKSTFALIDFLCDNDGARITSFVKEGGPSCFYKKRLELAFCQSEMQTNITKVANVYGTGPAGALMIPVKSFESVPIKQQLIHNPTTAVIASARVTVEACPPSTLATSAPPVVEQCGIMDDGLSCYANAMKSCSNKTPGNLAQELHDMYLKSSSCPAETYETQTEVAVGQVNVASQALPPSSGIRKDLDFLTKRKLQLEVRTAELDIWNRENQLKVQHTILTSDVQTRL